MEAGTARGLITLGWKQLEIFLSAPHAGNYGTKPLDFSLYSVLLNHSLRMHPVVYMCGNVHVLRCVYMCICVYMHTHVCA